MKEKNFPKHRNAALAGLLFFLAGSIILMGIITAEIFYPPGYSTANSEISDLGATRPPGSVSYQPSASIFNATMVIGGLLLIGASLFLYKALNSGIVPLFSLLLGTGVLGVGIFPGNNAFLHPLFALCAFLSGGLAQLASVRVVPSPFRYLFGVLGLTTLTFLFFSPFFIPVLGDGGTERFVAYPVIVWMTGFGGFLIGEAERSWTSP